MVIIIRSFNITNIYSDINLFDIVVNLQVLMLSCEIFIGLVINLVNQYINIPKHGELKAIKSRKTCAPTRHKRARDCLFSTLAAQPRDKISNRDCVSPNRLCQ